MTARSTPRPAGVRISGTGMSVPPRVLTNEDLTRLVDTSDEWITQRTGIKTRHVSDEDTRTSDLAAHAVRQALDHAGLDPADLDMLICATMTPDVICPAASALVVKKIGAIPCGAVDINIACTGLVAGLNHASALVETGMYRHVAVVGADTLTSITDYEDRSTCVLFGDAASAAIVSACDDEKRGCLYQSMGSDAQRGEALFVPRSERDVPDASRHVFTGKFDTLQMDGRAVYKFAVTQLAACVEEALNRTGLTADDVRMVVPHQSNIRMLESAWKRLGFDVDKVHINIDRFGNTSAASAGICLHECITQGKVREGDHVVFVAQGGGLSWGTSLWRL